MFGDWSSNQNGDLMIIHGDVMDIYLDSTSDVGWNQNPFKRFYMFLMLETSNRSKTPADSSDY